MCLMKIHQASLTFASLLISFRVASGQGFINLDFEQATIPPTPAGGWVYPADPTQCFPGWSVGGSGTVVMYNDLSLGAPATILMGPTFPNLPNYSPLQGSYSVLLYYFSAFGVPSLSQTAMIPADARSINFLVAPSQRNAVVTLNGVAISLVPIAGGRLAGDVTGFAGTVAQLTFSTPNVPSFPGQWFYFDDVQFSSSPIPEPTSCSLFMVAVPLLLWSVKRHHQIS